MKVLLINGSRSIAIELVLRNIIAFWQHILIVDNGLGGERIQRIAGFLNIPDIFIPLEGQDNLIVHELEQIIKANPRISAIALSSMQQKESFRLEKLIGGVAKRFRRSFIHDYSINQASTAQKNHSITSNYQISTIPANIQTSSAFSYIVSDSIRLQKISRRYRHITFGPY